MPERAADNDSEAARAAMCANMEGRMMLWDGVGRLPRQRSTRPGNSAASCNAHCRLLRKKTTESR